MIISSLCVVRSQYPAPQVGTFDSGDDTMDAIVALSAAFAHVAMSDVYVIAAGCAHDVECLGSRQHCRKLAVTDMWTLLGVRTDSGLRMRALER